MCVCKAALKEDFLMPGKWSAALRSYWTLSYVVRRRLENRMILRLIQLFEPCSPIEKQNVNHKHEPLYDVKFSSSTLTLKSKRDFLKVKGNR